MKVTEEQVARFLRKWGNEKTRYTYAVALNRFRKFCGREIETNELAAYLDYLGMIRRSKQSLYRAEYLIPRLEAFCKGEPEPKTTRKHIHLKGEQTAPNPYATIIAALEKTDAAGIAFTISKMRNLYNEAYTKINKSVAPVNWDAASWDKASERCKTAYDGLRRFKEVLSLLDAMMQYKTQEAQA